MNKIFDIDSPLTQFLTTLANFLIINLLTLVCCIPIITIGASLSAMHYVMLKIARHEEGYIVKPFFHAFKDNFKQATAEWLIFLAAFVLLGFEVSMMRAASDQFPTWMTAMIAALLVVFFLVFQWVFPLQMHFVNPVRTTLRNTFLLALGNFPRTLLMGLVWGIPVVAFLFDRGELIPLDIMFGLSFPAWLMAKIYSPVFKRFEPEEEEPTPDEEFTLQDFQKTQQAIHDTASASANPDIASNDKKEEQ